MTSPVPYPEFVDRLAKSGEDILSSLTPFKCQLMHAAIGVAGEALELLDAVHMRRDDEPIDMENFVEELGDLEFFLEHMRALVKIDHALVAQLVSDSPSTLTLAETISVLSAISGTLLDAVKKHVIYNKALDTTVVLTCLSSMEQVLVRLRSVADLDREGVLDANRVKLGKRYKDLTYSDAEAQARADKA
jgi:hypothetical protein